MELYNTKNGFTRVYRARARTIIYSQLYALTNNSDTQCEYVEEHNRHETNKQKTNSLTIRPENVK